MALSTTVDAIIANPTATMRRADDGYFGWTDRYGVRASFLPDSGEAQRHSRPYFIANY